MRAVEMRCGSAAVIIDFTIDSRGVMETRCGSGEELRCGAEALLLSPRWPGRHPLLLDQSNCSVQTLFSQYLLIEAASFSHTVAITRANYSIESAYMSSFGLPPHLVLEKHA